MKQRLLTLLLATLIAVAGFAQGYSQQVIEAMMDSARTNSTEALHWAENALKKNAKCSDAFAVQSRAYYYTKEYQQSLSKINQAIRFVGKQSYYPQTILLMFRGDVYQAVQEYDKALEDYTQAIKAEKQPNLRVLLYESRAKLYYELEQYAKAEADCRAITGLSDDLKYQLDLVDCLTQQSKYDEALVLADKIVRYHPMAGVAYQRRAAIHLLYGMTTEQEQELKSAIDDYLTYMSLDDDYSLDTFLLIALPNQNYALNALSTKIAQDGKNQRWLAARIRLHIEMRNYELALKDLDTMDSATEPSLFSYYQRSRCYDGLYEYAKQVQMLTEIINALQTPRATLYLERGIARCEAGQIDASIEDFNTSLQLQPDLAMAYSFRGAAYEMRQDDAEAMKDYNTALVYDSEDPVTLLQRGKLYLLKGDTVKAQMDFEKVLQLDTVSAVSAFALALTGHEQEGIQRMQQCVDNSKGDSQYYNLACLYALIDRKTEAVEALQKAVKAGYKSYEHIKNDRDLSNIRDCEGYKTILEELHHDRVSNLFKRFQVEK